MSLLPRMMANLSAPNPADYMTVAKAGTGADLSATDVGNLFWDLISGGQMSNVQKSAYDNAYNQWLYQTYQSPEALARQYEEAGLNRNFSQQGPSGSPQASASANLANSGIANSIRAVSGINSLLQAVQQGVGITSDILSIPKDQAYKTWRNMLSFIKIDSESSKALSALSKAYYDRIYYAGDTVYIDPETGEVSYTRDPMKSLAITQAGLRNDVMELMKGLRSYELNKMKPEQFQLLQKQIERLGTSIGIDQKTLEFFDANNISRILAPFLMFISKFM